MAKEEIELLIERGYYEEALSRIHELEDPLDRIEALTEVALAIHLSDGPQEWIPDIVEDAMYIAKKLKDPTDRIVAYSTIASSLSIMGYEEDAMNLFTRTIDETESVRDPIERGALLSELAYHLALAGHTESAIELFDVAFDTIMGAEVSYSLKVDGIIRIGNLLEKAGDRLPADGALPLYRMAFDIFDKLHVNQRAAVVEKKIELAETVYDVGLPSIRQALLEGRYHYALALIGRNYTGVSRLIGKLEVALWMKRMNSLEYPDVVDRAFEGCRNPRFTEENVQKIAALLTELGSLKRALEFARAIKDVRKRSDALRAIALKLAERKEFDEAREIAGAIPDPEVKAETIMEIGSIGEER